MNYIYGHGMCNNVNSCSEDAVRVNHKIKCGHLLHLLFLYEYS